MTHASKRCNLLNRKIPHTNFWRCCPQQRRLQNILPWNESPWKRKGKIYTGKKNKYKPKFRTWQTWSTRKFEWDIDYTSKLMRTWSTRGVTKRVTQDLKPPIGTKLETLLKFNNSSKKANHREIEQLISSINAESQNYTHHHKDPTTTKTKNKDKEEYICPKIHSTTTLKKSSVIHDLILALFVMSLNNPSTSLFQLKQGAHFILLYYLLVVQN